MTKYNKIKTYPIYQIIEPGDANDFSKGQTKLYISSSKKFIHSHMCLYKTETINNVKLEYEKICYPVNAFIYRSNFIEKPLGTEIDLFHKALIPTTDLCNIMPNNACNKTLISFANRYDLEIKRDFTLIEDLKNFEQRGLKNIDITIIEPNDHQSIYDKLVELTNWAMEFTGLNSWFTD